ncbi:MAG TPA: SDR family oxidoreductase [Sandaracinaceae bacterium LLY-WYZ-13_1]|nr:SDR family oxidoreductase [Sandaracinaceae bacterium LLY-WYZ-13_1]
MSERRRVTLVTGYPTSFLAVRVVREILTEQAATELRLVVQPKFWSRAEQRVAAMPAEHRRRVALLEGDAAAMDLGLAGEEFVTLAREVDVIHHCAAITYLGVDREVARHLNVDGTREVLELAQEADHLERLVHWSTALVAGGRRGYVLEEELEAPSGFRNAIEETRFTAERLVRRQAARIPTTILRPSIIVGDSVTGEIDRLEGPYLLVLLMLNAPVDLRVPLPGRGDIPLNLVPIDFVVDAGLAIVADRRSLGKTFHLVDPDAETARRVFELIADRAGRPVPRGFLPTNLATALLRTPGLERFAHVPRAFLEQLATEVVYDDRNAREILDELDIRCPPFEDYVDVMVEYVSTQQAERRAAREAPPAEPPTDEATS